MHDVFHTELLKPFKAGDRSQPMPNPVEVDGELEYEVEAILAEKTVKRGNQRKVEYMVKWANCAPDYNSWEPAENLENCAALDRYKERMGQVDDSAAAMDGSTGA